MYVSVTKERMFSFGYKRRGCRKEDEVHQGMLRVAPTNRTRREMLILHVNIRLVIPIKAIT